MKTLRFASLVSGPVLALPVAVLAATLAAAQPLQIHPPAAQPARPAPPAQPAAPRAPAPAPTPAPPPNAAPQASLPASHPLPPRRPADLPTGGASAPAASTGETGARPAPAAPAPAAAVPTNPQAALARVNAYLNGIDTLTANFLQYSGDGRQATGSLYVKRPGQLRFQYNPPSTLEIVADGRSVAIRDKKLRTQDVYSIGQTPLKFLVQDRVDLARDVKVLDVRTAPSGVVEVIFEDSSTLGGTSKVTLVYDAKANVLRQWIVVDPQGYETSVALQDVNIVPR
ncbi:outer membrane lipoprotein carrier protein LolA [Chelatococcus sp. XZ-Ab1]|uniref:LolA family protein n=1 Tax=Chelatococcus sp. XZ-Ab1 TaxID=3034027 RepID=UPI0023E44757|nr:outer membrane lipoprotein carrier protein LolA [Chelatococcus sp. XZ-Ab1]